MSKKPHFWGFFFWFFSNFADTYYMKRPYYKPKNVNIPRNELKKYLKNHTYAEAAKYFGYALKTIQNQVFKHQLTEDECKFDFISSNDLKLLCEKHTTEEIAEICEVPICRIAALYKIHNITKLCVRNLEQLSQTLRSRPLRRTNEDVAKAIESQTQKDAAKQLGISVASLTNHIERYGLHYKRKKPTDDALYDPLQLTGRQYNMLAGHMLGDGHISKASRNCRFGFAQKETMREWVTETHSCMHNFVGNITKTCKTFKDGRQFPSWRFRSICHPVFSELRRKWYLDYDTPNSQKIVPKDLSLNWEIVAVWYADDGCNAWYNKCVKLYTDGFLEEDVDFLINQLQNIGIYAKKYDRGVAKNGDRKHSIGVSGNDYLKFVNGVSPFLKSIPCLSYKIDTHFKPPSPPTKP